MSPNVAVLLPTYKQPERLTLTLHDLGEQVYDGAWHLVVLDDGSADSSSEIAVAKAPCDVPLTVVRRPGGGRYSHAGLFNEMIRVSPPDVEVFVHVEDVRLRSDLLAEHAKWHTGGGEYLVTGPMCEDKGTTFAPETCSRWPLMQDAAAPHGSCRCQFQAVFAKSMSYTRRLVELLSSTATGGPFDEDMEGWGYHETEFALRAELAGAICIYDARCAVYHAPHTPHEERYRGLERRAVLEDGTHRNVAYLCKKHGLPRLPEWQPGTELTDVIGRP